MDKFTLLGDINKTLSSSYFVFIQHTSTTDVQVCVKNYNSDANNRDIITVDYLITGGRFIRSKNNIKSCRILLLKALTIHYIHNSSTHLICTENRRHSRRKFVLIRYNHLFNSIGSGIKSLCDNYLHVSCQIWILASM